MKPFISFIVLSFCLQVAAAIPVKKGGLELWVSQPTIAIDAIVQDHNSGNSSHPGSPLSAEIQNQRESIRIDKIQITSEAIQVGSIDATISVGRLRLKNRTVINLFGKKIDQTTVVGSFDNVGVRIWLRHPLTIPLPPTIALRLRQTGNANALEMSERDSLQSYLQNQVDVILSDASFDKNFDHRLFNLSGPAELGFKLFLNSKKGQLLGSLRSGLKQEIAKPAYFDRFFNDMNHFMPMPYISGDQPAMLMMDRHSGPPANTWVIHEAGAEPTFSPGVQTQIPLSGLKAPWLTSVAHTGKLNLILQSYLTHRAAGGGQGLPSGVKLTPQAMVFEPSGAERQDILGLFAQTGSTADPSPSHVLAVNLAGDRAPILRPWYVGGGPGQPQQLFIDAWLSADWVDSTSPQAPVGRLGMLLVFSVQQDGAIKLLQFFPYRPGEKSMGPASDLSKNGNFGMRFGTQLKLLLVQSLLNARLASLDLKQNISGPFKLSGIRLLGDSGQRAPGEHLAEALAIDFLITTPEFGSRR